MVRSRNPLLEIDPDPRVRATVRGEARRATDVPGPGHQRLAVQVHGLAVLPLLIGRYGFAISQRMILSRMACFERVNLRWRQAAWHVDAGLTQSIVTSPLNAYLFSTFVCGRVPLLGGEFPGEMLHGRARRLIEGLRGDEGQCLQSLTRCSDPTGCERGAARAGDPAGPSEEPPRRHLGGRCPDLYEIVGVCEPTPTAPWPSFAPVSSPAAPARSP